MAEAIQRIVENPQLHAAICETQRVLGDIIKRYAQTHARGDLAPT